MDQIRLEIILNEASLGGSPTISGTLSRYIAESYIARYTWLYISGYIAKYIWLYS